ncbi:hypothetical protein GDO81_000092 [Engystomops pustulosus]|uniref:Uncharacterized protein n=1 Tax=Engystomops pustulosus TaxID=76066 RepID=A0AAV7D1B8_ENGPU|nr:hypothetical protein GDO81_000092 [Engystomops pustulosus]
MKRSKSHQLEMDPTFCIFSSSHNVLQIYYRNECRSQRFLVTPIMDNARSPWGGLKYFADQFILNALAWFHLSQIKQ